MHFFNRPVPVLRPLLAVAVIYTGAQALVQWTLGQEARQAPFAAPPPLAFLMGVQSFDHQLALADAALYRGKKSGRNCVQWAGPEDVPGEKPGDQAATTLMA